MALGRAKNTDSKWINESKQPWENQTVLRRKLHRVDACSSPSVLCCGSKFDLLIQQEVTLPAEHCPAINPNVM